MTARTVTQFNDGETGPMEKLPHALETVIDERVRQEKLKSEGRFIYTPADGIPTSDPHNPYIKGPSESQILGMIMEEVGEVARHVHAREGLCTPSSPPSNGLLYAEIAQIAALSVAWMERLLKETDRMSSWLS